MPRSLKNAFYIRQKRRQKATRNIKIEEMCVLGGPAPNQIGSFDVVTIDESKKIFEF